VRLCKGKGVVAGVASQVETACPGKGDWVAAGAASQPETVRTGKAERPGAASQPETVRPYIKGRGWRRGRLATHRQ